MAKIAFLGLGQMGAPMARRLLKTGHEVTVWNRTSHRAEPLAAEGAAVAGSPAEAGAGAEFAITMVATPAALQTLVLGENGLAKGLAAGHVYIDMSTVGPDTVRSIAARLPVGVAVVDAPVRGSVSQATEGRLEIFVGARDEDFERVRANIESGDYPPNFKLRHAAKDLRLVMEAATRAGRDLKVSAAARAWLDSAVEKGAADLDYSAVVATIIREEPHP
jgi:3-hydroxyisobutyrate dehydrogenase